MGLDSSATTTELLDRAGRPPIDSGRAVLVRDLGRMAYAPALDLQRSIQSEVIAGRESGGPMQLLLVEHDPPVITVSRRKGAADHLVATPAQLADAGVEVHPTDRGGDITYHGPGQLVAYPILDLNAFGLRLHGYMRLLEDVVIDTIAAFGVTGERDDGATGVWVAAGEPERPAAKIAAMGVRVSRWVSMHGLALNVAPNLEHFSLIVPCGLHGRPVTSLAERAAAAGHEAPEMADVKSTMLTAFAERLADARAQAMVDRDVERAP